MQGEEPGNRRLKLDHGLRCSVLGHCPSSSEQNHLPVQAWQGSLGINVKGCRERDRGLGRPTEDNLELRDSSASGLGKAPTEYCPSYLKIPTIPTMT